MPTSIKYAPGLADDIIERLEKLQTPEEHISLLAESCYALELIFKNLEKGSAQGNTGDKNAGLANTHEYVFCERRKLTENTRYKNEVPLEVLNDALELLKANHLIELAEVMFFKTGRPRDVILPRWGERTQDELRASLLSDALDGRNCPILKTRIQEVIAQRWVCKKDLRYPYNPGASGDIFHGLRGQPFPQSAIVATLNKCSEMSQVDAFIDEYLAPAAGGTSICCPVCKTTTVHFL